MTDVSIKIFLKKGINYFNNFVALEKSEIIDFFDNKNNNQICSFNKLWDEFIII